MSSLDTPARAARVQRPQTRTWRRLLSDAASKSATADAHRAELRRHLEAAAELARRRRRAPPPQRATEVYPALVCEDSAGSVPAEGESEASIDFIEILANAAAPWETRCEALRTVAGNACSETARAVALSLPAQIADPRSILASQVAETIAALSEFLTDEHAAILFCAAADGVSVTKKVIADARRRTALSVVQSRTSTDFWNRSVSKISHDQPAVRKLVIEAVQTLVPFAKQIDAEHPITRVLCSSAADRSADVREAAKSLFREYSSKHGNSASQEILDLLPQEARNRLAPKKKPQLAQRLTMREMMKAKKAAQKENQGKGKRVAEMILSNEAKRVAVNDQENIVNV